MRRLLVSDAPLRHGRRRPPKSSSYGSAADASLPGSRRLQREAALARMQHEQECCARALQAEEHRRQAAAVRAKAIANEVNQQKAAALRQRLRLVLSENVAERERQREAAARHEGATRAAESAALALVEDCRRHEAAMGPSCPLRALLRTSNPATRKRCPATCDLLVGPLDAILADIERKDIRRGLGLPNEIRRPPGPSSYGSAATSSLSGSITGLCYASNTTPLLHACVTSRTAAGPRMPPNALPRRPSRYANVSDLDVALVDATALACLVLQMRPHPPTHTKCWGASYASFDHIGASDLTLSLGGVINYALLDGTTYSLPPTLYFSW